MLTYSSIQEKFDLKIFPMIVNWVAIRGCFLKAANILIYEYTYFFGIQITFLSDHWKKNVGFIVLL